MPRGINTKTGNSNTFRDLTGKTFGRLRVLRRAGRQRRAFLWRCRCKCGAVVHVISFNLTHKRIVSCGCYQREHARRHLPAPTHKHSWVRGKASPEYSSWSAMKQRTANPHCARWDTYGGRGIRCCTLFLNSFEAFLKCLGPRPKLRDRRGFLVYTLDRINPNGHYTPTNVRWATRKNQQNNRNPRGSKQRVIRFVDVK